MIFFQLPPLYPPPSPLLLSSFLILSVYVSASFSLPLCCLCALLFINEMSRGEGSWCNSNILSDLFLVKGPGRGDELSLRNGKRKDGTIVWVFGEYVAMI